MHKKEQVLQRYLDGELGSAEKAEVEKHLAECATCQAHLDELKALASVLQRWSLPANQTRLQQPLSLPNRQATQQAKVGIIGWAAGIVIVVLFMMVQAVFLLSSQLNRVARLASVLGIDEQIEQLTASVSSLFTVQSIFFTTLGDSSERIILLLGLMLPILFYVICVGGLIVLYLNWFNLVIVNQPKKIRA
jgi:predicted anti-sigma-YlaC factor YlaD